jgi:glycosyltransferase involved in cell wall biosynthesis
MGNIKGTHLIHDTLVSLDSEGLIEYQALHGVPAFEMPKVIAAADIVLDQFRIGSYGVAAVEAMSTGRVVVGHVAQKVRSIVMSETGRELPVVEATPSTLANVLREICMNRDSFQKIARDGYEFARAIHSGKYSARVLETYWIADTQEQPLEKDD